MKMVTQDISESEDVLGRVEAEDEDDDDEDNNS